MVQTAQSNGLIKGLVLEYVRDGVAVLQHADDMMLCMEEDADTTQNMKILLYICKKMSGLKINFDKSEIVMVSFDAQKAIWYSDMMNCTTSHWPIKYLGVPVLGLGCISKIGCIWMRKFKKVGWMEMCLTVLWGETDPAKCMSQQHTHLCYVHVLTTKNNDK
jgi:mannosylglycoprotein endo-beta-mannosidase